MTAAVDAVKMKQTAFVIPEFRSGSDFVITSPPRAKQNFPIEKDLEVRLIFSDNTSASQNI